MAFRLYISKVIGDGLSQATAYKPAWMEVIPKTTVKNGQCIEAERYHFWLGQLDTTDIEHTALQADPRIRHIPQGLLSIPLVALTVGQRDSVAEVYTWLGFPSNIWDFNNARVADVLFYIMGRATWHPISQAADA